MLIINGSAIMLMFMSMFRQLIYTVKLALVLRLSGCESKLKLRHIIESFDSQNVKMFLIVIHTDSCVFK